MKDPRQRHKGHQSGVADLEPSPAAGEEPAIGMTHADRGARGQELGTASAGLPLISATPEWTAPSTLCSALNSVLLWPWKARIIAFQTVSPLD